MKTSSVLLIIISALVLSIEGLAQSKPATISGKPLLEIIYFHAPNRCPSCLATEDRTKEILDKHFRNEMASGRVSFASLDLKDEKNKALVEKYEIVFPTLLLIKKVGSEENVTDFSTTAFQYAYTDAQKYSGLLQAEIKKLLEIK